MNAAVHYVIGDTRNDNVSRETPPAVAPAVAVIQRKLHPRTSSMSVVALLLIGETNGRRSNAGPLLTSYK